MLNKVDDGTMQEAMYLTRNSDNLSNPDPDMKTSWFGLISEENKLHSYTGSKRILMGRLDDAYQERDKTMRRLHINPVVDITDGNYTKDDLNKIDAQVQKYNNNPLSTQKLQTNNDILNNIKSKIQRLNREIYFGNARRGIVSKLAANVVSGVLSAGQDPLQTATSIAQFGAMTATDIGLGAITGGAYYIPAVGSMAVDYAFNVNNARQDNEVNKILGYKTSNIYKSAGVQTAFDAVLQHLPVGQYFKKAYSETVGKAIGKAVDIGKSKLKGAVEDDLIKGAYDKASSSVDKAINPIQRPSRMEEHLDSTFNENIPIPQRITRDDLKSLYNVSGYSPQTDAIDLSKLTPKKQVEYNLQTTGINNADDALLSNFDKDDSIRPVDQPKEIFKDKTSYVAKPAYDTKAYAKMYKDLKARGDSTVLKFDEKYKLELTDDFKKYLLDPDPEIRAVALQRLKETDITDIIQEEMNKKCNLFLNP